MSGQWKVWKWVSWKHTPLGCLAFSNTMKIHCSKFIWSFFSGQIGTEATGLGNRQALNFFSTTFSFNISIICTGDWKWTWPHTVICIMHYLEHPLSKILDPPLTVLVLNICLVYKSISGVPFSLLMNIQKQRNEEMEKWTKQGNICKWWQWWESAEFRTAFNTKFMRLQDSKNPIW